MSVKTVRFNKQEIAQLKKILAHYNNDFSSCVKELIAEKLEDLQDIAAIKKIKEGPKKDYVSADTISAQFKIA